MAPILFVASLPAAPLWAYLAWIAAALLGGAALAPRFTTRRAFWLSLYAVSALGLGVGMARILFPWRPVAVSSYGVCFASALLLGGALSLLRLQRAGIVARELGPWLAGTLASGLVGAHLAGALLAKDSTAHALALANGGGLLVAGLAFGGLAGWLGARWLGLPWRKLVDACLPGLWLGIALGRVGCLLHGCEFGAPTESALAVTYPAEVFDAAAQEWIESPATLYQHSPAFAARAPEWVPWLAAYDDRSQGAPLSLPVHPWPLYEATLALLLAFLGWRSARRWRPGRAALVTVLVYVAARLVLESWRGEPFGL